MYSYDFTNEKVINEYTDMIVDINDKTYNLNILITNLNILLFLNIEKFNALNGREVFLMPKYELVKIIKLDNLQYICEDGDTIIETEKLIIYNFKLDEVLTNNLKS